MTAKRQQPEEGYEGDCLLYKSKDTKLSIMKPSIPAKCLVIIYPFLSKSGYEELGVSLSRLHVLLIVNAPCSLFPLPHLPPFLATLYRSFC